MHKHRIEASALRNLSNFFLVVGNGDTLSTLRGLINEVESGVSLDDIFKRVVDHARVQAEEKSDPFSRLKDWATIASHTKSDEDFTRAEDILPEVKTSNQRGMAKKLLVRALAHSDHFEDARTFAGNIKSGYWRAEAFMEVHEVSKDPADIALAESAMDHIHNKDIKDEVAAQIRAARHRK